MEITISIYSKTFSLVIHQDNNQYLFQSIFLLLFVGTSISFYSKKPSLLLRVLIFLKVKTFLDIFLFTVKNIYFVYSNQQKFLSIFCSYGQPLFRDDIDEVLFFHAF